MLYSFLRSSIGKKMVVAVTGLLLVGFLLSHLAGNLLLLVDDGGVRYNAYAQGLKDLGPLLTLARVGLASLFLVHIVLALRLARQNRRARGSRATGLRSRTMLLTGLTILIFLIVHLRHFTFDGRFDADGAGLVRETLRSGPAAFVYGLALVVLGVHLWHAMPSALQSLGLSHPRWSRAIHRGARAVTTAIALLFLLLLSVTFFPG